MDPILLIFVVIGSFGQYLVSGRKARSTSAYIIQGFSSIYLLCYSIINEEWELALLFSIYTLLGIKVIIQGILSQFFPSLNRYKVTDAMEDQKLNFDLYKTGRMLGYMAIKNNIIDNYPILEFGDKIRNFLSKNDRRILSALISADGWMNASGIYKKVKCKDEKYIFRRVRDLYSKGIIERRNIGGRGYEYSYNYLVLEHYFSTIKKNALTTFVTFTSSLTHLAKYLENDAVLKEMINYLFLIQQPDGGWGIEGGSMSSPLNTAEILLFVFNHNDTPSEKYEQALQFLVDAQDEAGFWYCKYKTENDSPSIISTARCLQTVALFLPENKEVIEKGQSWLLNVIENGGWGEVPSNAYSIYSSCCVIEALLSCEELDKSSLRVYGETLLNTQNSDGSFSLRPDGPSSITASLQALHLFQLFIDNRIFWDELSESLKKIKTYLSKLPAESIRETEFDTWETIPGNAPAQFEHLNAVWLIYIYLTHNLTLNNLFPIAVDFLSKLVQSGGAGTAPNGRKYSWTTAQCYQAWKILLENKPKFEETKNGKNTN